MIKVKDINAARLKIEFKTKTYHQKNQKRKQLQYGIQKQEPKSC